MKVLHFILHDNLFPPKSGGMLRCWNLMLQLSKYYEVDVITSQVDIVERLNQKGFLLPNTTSLLYAADLKVNLSGIGKYPLLNRFLGAIKYRWAYRTLSSADSSLLGMLPLLKSIASNHYDFVIFEHLESLKAYKKIRSLFPKALIILDAHNVDHILLKDIDDEGRLKSIQKTESTLYKKCDLVLTTSREDAAILKTINKRDIALSVVPNGVNIESNNFQLPVLFSDPVKLIFCGSLDYEPNQIGLTWFLNYVWQEVIKKHPGILLTIIGRGHPGEALLNLLENSLNINFIGEVEDVIPYYRAANCAIVPLLHGSGTRLKILEAMSLGIPVISTSIGAAGIRYHNEENIFICDEPYAFVDRIDRLYEMDASFKYISTNARDLVQKEYSWDLIGYNLHQNLEGLVKK